MSRPSSRMAHSLMLPLLGQQADWQSNDWPCAPSYWKHVSVTPHPLFTLTSFAKPLSTWANKHREKREQINGKQRYNSLDCLLNLPRCFGVFNAVYELLSGCRAMIFISAVYPVVNILCFNTVCILYCIFSLWDIGLVCNIMSSRGVTESRNTHD